jgi:hypothetical protein
MTHVPINEEARKAVYERSEGICERCGDCEAVHIHHLTYERAGCELPEDLEHVCIWCHCDAHPQKRLEILVWEFNRTGRLASSLSDAEIETEEERRQMEEGDEEYQMRKREEKRREEMERNEPAWNLGRFQASGYSIEDVEREEMNR